MSEEVKVYTKFDFQREVFGTDAVELINILEYKKNIILQGAPGVGKTYTAKRLAYAMMGVKDDSRLMQVQFHQNYTYDDFIIGLKPNPNGGFSYSSGPFYKICKKAAEDKEKKSYFMIIDEINRGNMSKVLGEAFSLIEKDHRNEKITLKYRGEKFMVPDNLYIIGTMNTADRGLVMIDYALRRRFSFIPVEPKFKSTGFRQIMKITNSVKLNKIVHKIQELNQEICKDEMLGKGFMVGHSYFCTKRKLTEEEINNIVLYEIIPLLEEYWYDNEDKLNKWVNSFMNIINNSN